MNIKKLLKYRTHDIAFTSRMPAGIPGDISRKENSVIEARVYDATLPPLLFGQPVVISASAGMRRMQPGDAGTAVYGFLVRPFPIANANTTDGIGVSTPNTVFPADIARKAYMNVLLQNTTAAALGAQVYVRTAATSGSLVQGGIEAAASSSVAQSYTGTGNGTVTSLAAGSTAIPGAYKLKCVQLVTTPASAEFELFDPNGNLVDDQAIGQTSTNTIAFANSQLAFTLTTGTTAWAQNDTFTLTPTLTNVAVPNAIFTGPADSAGNVEIAYKQ